MGFLRILTFLSMAMYVSHAANVAPETYWRSMLPNTPMPKGITNLLNHVWCPYNSCPPSQMSPYEDKGTHFHVGESDATIFGYDARKDLLFLEKDMIQGHEMNLQFAKTVTPSSNFFSRKVAEMIPFSLKNLPQLYTRFSIKPESVESESMKTTISRCEEAGEKGEKKFCATSLEAMVDFIISKLGKKVMTISTDVKSNKVTPLQKYTFEGSKKVATDKYIVCHKQKYPYPVYYCHRAASTRVYSVSLVGEDGTKGSAVAICHKNASKLYPKDLVFKVLKVKPGTNAINICHFLPEDHVVWVPY